MEPRTNLQERENQSLMPSSSPTSTGSNAVTKSAQRLTDPCSNPTTFVQADSSSFKQVVQMLTGSAETAAAAAAAAAAAQVSPSSPPPLPMGKNPIPSPGKLNGPKKPAFKLYERRESLRNLKAISPQIPSLAASFSMCGSACPFSPRKQPEILSPSMLDFPSLVLSPVTPLIPDPFNRSPRPPPFPGSAAAVSAEDRAIAEKGFYLHPSPRSDVEPPQLLPLFPETSPRLSSSSSSSP
ncbi:hypothetical protein HPP92_028257 [Vanilla planifolia]|uniref:VQ domain-containing protein n=1 Tax=Vanilla planifolia TaxID=51239 RepID=A0A835P7Z3_VANPL|nr:hypothetical protein HPP92_028257 [Vanilla planifolia]KAG0447696.1 hypothetical protein HPP92_028220 [Vanilla planifolia]